MGVAARLFQQEGIRVFSENELEEALAEVPAVEHVALLGGQFDVILLVRAVDSQELRDIVFEHIQPLPYVIETQTHLIFEDVHFPRQLRR